MGIFDKLKSMISGPETAKPKDEGLEARIAEIEAREAEGRPAQPTREELAAARATQAEFDAQQVEALRGQISQMEVRPIPKEEAEAIGEQLLAQAKGEMTPPKPGKGNVQGFSAEALQNYVTKVRMRGGQESGVAQGSAETAAIEEANRAATGPASFEGASSADSTARGTESAPLAEDYRDVAEAGGMFRLEDLKNNPKRPGNQDSASV